MIKSAEELDQLQDGEILVATTTSPSWAPAFTKIAGAITDVGGAMCHAAIVCREYGLPTVVGTGRGTSVIKTGDVVRIDGDEGARDHREEGLSDRPGKRSAPVATLVAGYAREVEVVSMSDKESKLLLWYEELEGSDYPLVGKKNANLGEMLKGGIRTSPGFALTLHANDLFITETGIKDQLADLPGLPWRGHVGDQQGRPATSP